MTTAKKTAKALQGRRVLVTRARKQSAGLTRPLRLLGAKVVEVPTIEIKAPRSYAPLDSALRKAADYDWLILTSVNGVEALFARLKKLRIPVDLLRHMHVAAIGPATRQAIEDHGLPVTVTPPKYIAESVVEALRGRTEGKYVLLVRAKIARDVLPTELRKAGAAVDVVEAYETHVPRGAATKLKKLFTARNKPHVITFTSSSTATNFLSLLGKNAPKLLEGISLASIGPVTSATLTQAGYRPSIEAREYTMQGLVEAIRAIGN
ncbi:MAG TPA: uroporphyrinogen-III synthase [Candidatus Saccharimonadales bacterium]|jgi:uroporphyrinogen-III synthase|nr:uroporphyrinogen-III synthase [Candidatus Saccharimonadales bacterium]